MKIRLSVLRLLIALTLNVTILGGAICEKSAETAKIRDEIRLAAALDDNRATTESESNLLWYRAQDLTLTGKGWKDTSTWSTRLTSEAMDRVTSAVAVQAKSSAGIAVHFATDATHISAAWDSQEPMSHMARTGSGGLDLYERTAEGWTYCGTGIPRGDRTVAKIGNLRPGTLTEYLLYLPTYSPIAELKIGVNAEAKIMPAADSRGDRLPVVFYGTSITQAGCASRAGMGHVSILGRWLDREVINLGFSGAGKCEPYMAELLAQIPASLYVIETLPNMSTDLVRERVYPFVKSLRKAQPHTPILLVQNPIKSNDSEQNQALTKIYESLKTEGMSKVSILPSKGQLDGKENGTVDGVHPTDLGFYWMADAYLPVIESMLDAK